MSLFAPYTLVINARVSPEAERALRKLQTSVAATHKKVKADLDGIARAARISAIVFTGAFLAVGAAAVKSTAQFANFQKQMAFVSTMVRDTDKWMNVLSSRVLELSKTYGQSTESISKALYDILSAQIDVSKSTYVLEEAMKAAIAGATDVSTAVSPIITILKAYQLEATKAGDVSDLLFSIVEKGRLCVTGDTKVLLADGRYKRIDSLRDEEEIISWDYRTFVKTFAKLQKLGKKQVVELKTKFGRKIRTTPEHPYLTPSGWKEVQELKIGDEVLVPSSLPFFGSKRPPRGLAYLLGWLIAEGDLCNPSIGYGSKNKYLNNIANKAAEDFGMIVTEQKKRNHDDCPIFRFVSYKRGCGFQEENKLIKYIRKIGLKGKKSFEKFVPDEVFKWDKESIKEFLRGYFNGDGSIFAKDKNSPSLALEFSSTSEQLAYDISHLLLRFGINGKIRKITAEEKNRNKSKDFHKFVHDCYQWSSDRILEVYRFLNIIGLDKSFESQDRIVDRAGIFKVDKKYKNFNLKEICDYKTVHYEKISKLEYQDEEEVYDLTVPEWENFVANDIIAHNTFEDLAQNLRGIPALAASAGIEMEELGAVIATATRGGVDAASAMTSLRQMINAFLSPSKQAQKAAREIGLELNKDTLEALGLRGAINLLAESNQDYVAQIFTNVRALRNLYVILQDLEGFYGDIDDMYNRQNATLRAYSKMLDTQDFQIRKLKETYNAFVVSLGRNFYPIISKVLSSIQSITENMSKWTYATDTTGRVTKQLSWVLKGLLLAAFQSIAVLLSVKLIPFIVALISRAKLLTVAMEGVATTSLKLKTIITAMGGPLNLLIYLLTTAVAAGSAFLLWNKMTKAMSVSIDDLTKDIRLQIKALEEEASQINTLLTNISNGLSDFEDYKNINVSIQEIVTDLANKGYVDLSNRLKDLEDKYEGVAKTGKEWLEVLKEEAGTVLKMAEMEILYEKLKVQETILLDLEDKRKKVLSELVKSNWIISDSAEELAKRVEGLDYREATILLRLNAQALALEKNIKLTKSSITALDDQIKELFNSEEVNRSINEILKKQLTGYESINKTLRRRLQTYKESEDMVGIEESARSEIENYLNALNSVANQGAWSISKLKEKWKDLNEAQRQEAIETSKKLSEESDKRLKYSGEVYYASLLQLGEEYGDEYIKLNEDIYEETEQKYSDIVKQVRAEGNRERMLALREQLRREDIEYESAFAKLKEQEKDLLNSIKEIKDEEARINREVEKDKQKDMLDTLSVFENDFVNQLLVVWGNLADNLKRQDILESIRDSIREREKEVETMADKAESAIINLRDKWRKTVGDIADIGISAMTGFIDAVKSAFREVVVEGKLTTESLRDIWNSFIEDLIDMFLELARNSAVQWLAKTLFNISNTATGNSVIPRPTNVIEASMGGAYQHGGEVKSNKPEISLLHPREIVLPPDIAEAFKRFTAITSPRLASVPTSSGSSSVVIISAVDSKSFRDALLSNRASVEEINIDNLKRGGVLKSFIERYTK